MPPRFRRTAPYGWTKKRPVVLCGAAAAHCPIVSAANPTLLPKAIKNAAEIANERTAHLRDGAALTQWIFWLKATVGRSLVTERSAAEKLEALRARQPHYLEPSFDPIVAYGSHGAIVHYSATEESDIPLEPQGFLLSDTGGHYLEGTTDVTRTIALGPVSADMKRHYTLVLRSHLHLLHAQFLYGCRGSALDMIARQPYGRKAWITTMAPATAWDISSASTRGRILSGSAQQGRMPYWKAA